MTIAKDFASKAGVAFVAAAMILSMFAPAAQAQSNEDLQTMINTLLAQIASLQAQVGQGGSSVSSGVCPYTWTRDLSQGSTGGDVMKLQQFLNADLDTRVSASGAGSVGAETQYFGPATAAAVSKMQVKYRSEVLSPAGLVNPTGFFGPSSRAKANAICSASAVVVPPVVVDPTTPTTPTTPGGSTSLSGEADLDSFDVEDPADDKVEEGDADVEIGLIKVEYSNGDASISRLDVKLDHQSGTQSNPWQTFDTISLWVDGDMVAEVDAGAKSDYLSSSNGTLRFSGLDIVAMEDEELEITIGATIKSSVRSMSAAEVWEVSVVSLRFFDADGVAETVNPSLTPYNAGAASFTIEEAGANDEVIVRSSSNNPESTTLKVEDDSRSEWLTVFAFDIDTDDSVNDIEISTVTATVTTSANYNTVVDGAELYIDGIRVNKFTTSPSNGSSTVVALTFDADDKVTLDAGDRVRAELKLRFKALAVEGTTVSASIASGAISAEGVDTFVSSGASAGKTHTLRSTGVDVSAKSTSAVVTAATQGISGYGTFKITMDVTAFEQDVFIPINAASTTWELRDANNGLITPASASTTVVVESSAEEGGTSNAFFEIKEGETETVTITVTYTPGSAAPQVVRLQLMSLVFDETGTPIGGDDKTWSALPANQFRTNTVTLQN